MNINYDGLVCHLNAKPSSKKQEQWIDSSGNNNNAILTNVSNNDFNGDYVQFSGSSYATLPRCIQDDFTLSAEVILERSTSSNVQTQYWYAHAALIDAEAANIVNDFGLTISKDGHAYFGVGNPDLTISYTKQSLFGEKHIITCTRSKTSGEFALYLDGCLIQKRFHPNKAALTSSPSIYIGRGINNKYLSMRLFSIRLYSRVLSEFEINQDTFFLKEKQYINHNNISRLVEKLSDASNIKITGNKYGNRVQTVIDKIVKKADNVTKAINQEVVNNTHSFKAGTGNNVNVSSDVQDSFSEIAIKGQTYQNLYPKLNRSNYKNIYESVKFDGDIIKFTANGTWQNIFLKKEALMVKPSTTYTLVIDILKNTIVNTQSDSMLYLLNTNTIFSDQISCFTSQIELNKNATIGRYKFQVNTKNDLSVAGIATRCFLDTYASSGELWIKYSLLEGDHTNNPNLPSYFEGIVGVGDKSKNLLNPVNFVSSNGISITKKNMLEINLASDGGQRTIYKGLKIPKGQYTVTIEVIEGNYTGGNLIFYNSSDNKFSEVPVPGIHGVNTNNNDIDKLTLWAVKGICKLRIQIEEGMVSTQYEPYYDGYKIQVKSTGKNLFDGQLQRGYWYNKGLQSSDYAVANINNIPIKTNTCYSFYVENYIGNIYIEELNDELQGIKNFAIKSGQFINTTNGSFLRFCTAHNESDKVKKDVKIQIEENTIATSYESYKQDKLEFLLNEPLMKLPNGVYDEITQDGKLIRRIGKVLLNGSEGWFKNTPPNHGSLNWFMIDGYISVKGNNGTIQPILCDKLQAETINLYIQAVPGICVEKNYNGITRIQINTTETNLETWLKQHPTTLYYELDNPIITDLSNNQIKLFKNGHLTFNTLVAPESTHIVQLNKSAQIHNAIKQSQLLDNKIAVLENNYDSLMLATMSTLNDLELDYTLK